MPRSNGLAGQEGWEVEKFDVNINGFGVLIEKRLLEVALCTPDSDYSYMTPERAEALADALRAAARVARRNKVKNENYQATSQTN